MILSQNSILDSLGNHYLIKKIKKEIYSSSVSKILTFDSRNIFFMDYRKLFDAEIASLKLQGCTADEWNNISVHPNFNTENVHFINFSGSIQLGVLEGEFKLAGGYTKHSALRNANLHNCIIGNNVLIENVQNYIANYRIGDNTFIQNIHFMFVEGESTFGNGFEVSVLNETGGREVAIYDNLSAHFAYVFTFYRHRPELIKNMRNMVRDYTKSITSSMGTIGNNVKIVNAGAIKNVRIGDCASIEGARLLENGSINSNQEAPVHIGYSVIANDFIISSGARITDGVMIARCFIGQACQLGHTYSASDSLFFSNCQGENGEACAIFAGPYTVTHHKSTLLIAGMFSFMNAGSGSNQSNHMYKLGPIHQGIVERGGKTTSNSYILWPARIGAFSLIMGRHKNNSDTSKLPFSYLIENNDESVLVPGVNLRSVGTIRDAQKFPKRDRRRDSNLLDFINFNLLSPYTVQKMFKGIEVLNNLKANCGETSKSYSYQGCVIRSSSLSKGIDLYNIAIKKFLGNSIISRLKDCTCETNDIIRARLKPDSDVGLGEWRDLSGLLAPQTEIDKLIEDIESGSVNNTMDMHNRFEVLHRDYYALEWAWAWDKIKTYYDLSLETVTATDVIHIVEQWKEAVVGLDRMIYADAKKEFSLSSRISFGLDGNRYVQKIDFEQVRGVFEENSFVEAVLRHIEVKSSLGDDLIGRLS